MNIIRFGLENLQQKDFDRFHLVGILLYDTLRMEVCSRQGKDYSSKQNPFKDLEYKVLRLEAKYTELLLASDLLGVFSKRR